MSGSTSNRKIAKNTVLLYLRMMLLMFISFYTSRIVLKVLGVDDFGVYNVVGGIVAMLSFVSNSMSLASNRFFSYALGKHDVHLLNRTYSTTVIIHFVFSIIIIILAETVGIWYFYTYLNIPVESMGAAMWVYQLSIASTFVAINNVPSMSLIVSHEDMGIYAYVSLLEGLLKLGVAFLLMLPEFANLKAYAILTFIVSIVIRLLLRLYSRRKYRYCKFQNKFDRSLFKEMYSFVGWQIVGSFSWLLRNQGVNLVLNSFFGPTLNASRALALQVNSGITSLVSNFQMASNPQIVKTYASEDIKKMHKLLFASSKMSFLLLFVFAFPVLLNASAILRIWLGDVPEYAVVFVQLIIIATLIDSLSGTLQHTALATGKIQKYTKVVTVIMLSDILLVYCAFAIGMPPTAMMYADMIVYFCAFVARLIVSRGLFSLSVREFIREVTYYELLVTILALLAAVIYKLLICTVCDNFIVEMSGDFVISLAICFYIGLSSSERKNVKQLLKARLKFCR